MTGQDVPVGIAIDAAHVYWASRTTGVWRANKPAGASVEPFFSIVHASGALAVDDSHVFAQDRDADAVIAIDKVDRQATVIAHETVEVTYFLADAEPVYFAVHDRGAIVSVAPMAAKSWSLRATSTPSSTASRYLTWVRSPSMISTSTGLRRARCVAR